MSQTEAPLHTEPPVGHVRVVYLGPVAPHWELQSDFGDRAMVDGFRDRMQARLQLVPPHDPQFRRNRERVIRAAEREHLLLDWDLGAPEDAGPARGVTSGGSPPAQPRAGPALSPGQPDDLIRDLPVGRQMVPVRWRRGSAPPRPQRRGARSAARAGSVVVRGRAATGRPGVPLLPRRVPAPAGRRTLGPVAQRRRVPRADHLVPLRDVGEYGRGVPRRPACSRVVHVVATVRSPVRGRGEGARGYPPSDGRRHRRGPGAVPEP